MGRRLAAAAVERALIATRALAIALAVGAALVASGPDAVAQDAPARRATSAFERGLALYQAGDYVGAADEFQVSYELDPRPQALFAWAQAARLSDDCITASELYRELLAGDPSAEDAAAARSALEMCEARIAEAVARADDEPAPTEPAAGDELAELGDEPEDIAAEAPLDDDDDDIFAAPARSPTARTTGSVRRSTRRAAPPPARLFAFARIDVDARGRGAVVAPGIDLAMASGWELFASALIGGNRGAEAGARFAATSGRLRTFATIALPVFTVDGYHPGLRAGLGVRAPFGDDLAVSLEVGGAHALSAPAGASRTVALVSVAIELGL